ELPDPVAFDDLLRNEPEIVRQRTVKKRDEICNEVGPEQYAHRRCHGTRAERVRDRVEAGMARHQRTSRPLSYHANIRPKGPASATAWRPPRRPAGRMQCRTTSVRFPRARRSRRRAAR